MTDDKVNQASFIEHLTELRSRLFKSIIYIFIFFVISYTFAENIYGFLVQPYADAVKDDENIRVVVLSGSGRAFSSGADLAEADSDWDGAKDALLNGYKPSFENIISMPKPVIASIRGPAAGIGAAFAMACDLRIMSEDAYILSVFSNIALVPDGGLSWLLPKYLGYGKAYEYAIEAKKIDAKECLHYGIANKVSTSEKLEEDTINWAMKLVKRSPQALANTKRLMRKSLSSSYWDIYSDFIVKSLCT